MAAKALGFSGSDRYLIELMDEFKLTGAIESNVSLSESNKMRFQVRGMSISGRQYLQNFGNHAREIFGKNFWIDQVLPDPARYDEEDKSDRYDELLEEKYPGISTLFITDVRYPNEAERIRHLGGVVWEVIRPGVESDGHVSEWPLSEKLVDWTLYNDTTPEALSDSVSEALFETWSRV